MLFLIGQINTFNISKDVESIRKFFPMIHFFLFFEYFHTFIVVTAANIVWRLNSTTNDDFCGQNQKEQMKLISGSS